MPNSNAQAIAFANGRIRPMADLLSSAYLAAKKIIAEWNAQSVASVIPNDATVISDGAATDGRPQITDAQATAIITRATEYVTWWEGTGALSAVPATGGTVVGVAVNGRSPF